MMKGELERSASNQQAIVGGPNDDEWLALVGEPPLVVFTEYLNTAADLLATKQKKKQMNHKNH